MKYLPIRAIAGLAAAALVSAAAPGAAPAVDAPVWRAPMAYAGSQAVPAVNNAPLGDADQEQFLRDAKVLRTRATGKGVTESTRATLVLGPVTHDAHIQIVDDYRREFRTTTGVEFDFRDTWMFNIAAYKLDRLIGLHMVPVSVARSFRTIPGAFTWWVDDVIMDEGTRLKSKAATPPAHEGAWQQDVSMLRLFDQLIENTDRNPGNILITSQWRVWAIDHTRAFRTATSLRIPAYVSRCDRLVFGRLKALDRPTLRRELGAYLDNGRIDAVLARRDLIVEKLAGLGEQALFDRADRRR